MTATHLSTHGARTRIAHMHNLPVRIDMRRIRERQRKRDAIVDVRVGKRQQLVMVVAQLVRRHQ